LTTPSYLKRDCGVYAGYDSGVKFLSRKLVVILAGRGSKGASSALVARGPKRKRKRKWLAAGGAEARWG